MDSVVVSIDNDAFMLADSSTARRLESLEGLFQVNRVRGWSEDGEE